MIGAGAGSGGSRIMRPKVTIESTATVDHISVSPATASVVEGNTQQLTSTVYDAANNVLLGRTTTWESANASVATVDSAGLVTAVAAGGPVNVTGTCETKTDTCAVTVSAAGGASPLYSTDFSSYANGASVAGTGASGFLWGVPHDAVVVTADLTPPGGGKCLRFPFDSTGNWGEQEFTHPEVQEYWSEFYIYYLDGTEGLGDRYEHRNGPSSDNNKFWTFWSGSYSSLQPRGNWSTWPVLNADLDSTVAVVFTHGEIGDGVPYWEPGPWPVLVNNDVRGTWARIRIHIKIADFGQSNGAFEFWRDATKLWSVLNEPNYDSTNTENYLDAGNLLGAANSGFSVDTFVYIGGFKFYTSDPVW